MRHPLLLAGLAMLATLTIGASLTGCSAISSVSTISALNPPVQSDYTSWSDVASTADPTPPPPAFVPHDATSIYVRVRPADGVAILTYTSPTPAVGCAPGPLTGKPKLDANWWPVAKPPAEGVVCPSGWRLFERDGVTFGWRSTQAP